MRSINESVCFYKDAEEPPVQAFAHIYTSTQELLTSLSCLRLPAPPRTRSH